MYELGVMYYSGDGVAEDEREGMKWLKMAAAKGDHIAGEIYRQWNASKRDEHLDKLLGEDYISQYGRAVVLRPSINGKPCSQPLPKPSYPYKFAAYCSISEHDDELLCLGKYKIGKKLKLRMFYPFYCKIGDSFYVSFGFAEFLCCELLGVIKIEYNYADISVRVLSDGNYLSSVREVSDDQKEKLASARIYDYQQKHSDYDNGPIIEYSQINEQLLCVREYWMYDYWYHNVVYIYTDNNGIDHLVCKGYQSDEESECMFGDKVLGYHKYCHIEIDKE